MNQNMLVGFTPVCEELSSFEISSFWSSVLCFMISLSILLSWNNKKKQIPVNWAVRYRYKQLRIEEQFADTSIQVQIVRTNQIFPITKVADIIVINFADTFIEVEMAPDWVAFCRPSNTCIEPEFPTYKNFWPPPPPPPLPQENLKKKTDRKEGRMKVTPKNDLQELI